MLFAWARDEVDNVTGGTGGKVLHLVNCRSSSGLKSLRLSPPAETMYTDITFMTRVIPLEVVEKGRSGGGSITI